MERKGMVELYHKLNDKEFRMLVPAAASMGEVYDSMVHIMMELVQLMKEAVKKDEEEKKIEPEVKND